MTKTRATQCAAIFWGGVLAIGVFGFDIPSDFGLGISDFPHFVRSAG